jgi:hypothetical protein
MIQQENHRVHGFKALTKEEAQHDFFWSIEPQAPKKGKSSCSIVRYKYRPRRWVTPANGRIGELISLILATVCGHPTSRHPSGAGLRKEIGLAPTTFFGTQSSQKFNCDIDLLF